MRCYHLSFLLTLAMALNGAVSTEDVLGQMDQSAPKFTGLTADLTKVTYTKVIDERTTESGSMSLKKIGPRELQVLIDFVKPDAKTVAFRGRKAEMYYPKLKTVQEYDIGKQRGLVDQFLLVRRRSVRSQEVSECTDVLFQPPVSEKAAVPGQDLGLGQRSCVSVFVRIAEEELTRLERRA